MEGGQGGRPRAGADDLASLPTFRATFSHRPTTRLVDSAAHRDPDSVLRYYFLELMTCLADLYSQSGVLEMREHNASGKTFLVHASGATSRVTQITAPFAQLSGMDFYELQKRERLVVMKKYPPGLFYANGQAHNSDMARSFITELKVLCHPGIRRAEQIVTALGLYWDMAIPAAPEPVIVLEHAAYSLDAYLEK